MHPYWTALAEIPGLMASRFEWQRRLGGTFDSINQYFRPTGELAQSVTTATGRSYRVVDHGMNEFVGSSPMGHPNIKLSRNQVMILEVDQGKLCGEIARSLSLKGQCVRHSSVFHTWQLGARHRPRQSDERVYLMFRLEEIEYQMAVLELQHARETPSILITPVELSCFFGDWTQTSLQELFEVTESGELMPLWSGSNWLAGERTIRSKAQSMSWPDSSEHTIGKVWTVQSGALRFKTQTDGRDDGQAEFGTLQSGMPTLQKQLMVLLCHTFPHPVTVSVLLEQLYREEFDQCRTNVAQLKQTLKKLIGLVSDVRTKKLEKNKLNPDILPALNAETTLQTGIALRLLRLDRLDDRGVHAAD